MRPIRSLRRLVVSLVTLTALVVLDLVARSGHSIEELTADLKVFPQVILNIRVRERRPLDQIPSVADAIHAAQVALVDSGRVVIRYSGTEPKLRLLFEGPEKEPLERWNSRISTALKEKLGV